MGFSAACPSVRADKAADGELDAVATLDGAVAAFNGAVAAFNGAVAAFDGAVACDVSFALIAANASSLTPLSTSSS